MLHDSASLELFFKLLLALALGGAIGLEREYRRKEAGLRTYTLIALGSALFTMVGLEGFGLLFGQPGAVLDPSRIISAVATGLGFIGAGVIIYRQFHVEGLTTAAGLWTAGAIGAAVGVGFYAIAIFTTLLVLAVLEILRWLEVKIFHKGEPPSASY